MTVWYHAGHNINISKTVLPRITTSWLSFTNYRWTSTMPVSHHAIISPPYTTVALWGCCSKTSRWTLLWEFDKLSLNLIPAVLTSSNNIITITMTGWPSSRASWLSLNLDLIVWQIIIEPHRCHHRRCPSPTPTWNSNRRNQSFQPLKWWSW